MVSGAHHFEGTRSITSVAGRVPFVLIVTSCLGGGEKSLLQDTWVARLIEGSDAELLVRILLDDAQGIFVCVERRHQDQRNVDLMSGIEVLDLANSQVQESHVILDFESGFGSGHALR